MDCWNMRGKSKGVSAVSPIFFLFFFLPYSVSTFLSSLFSPSYLCFTLFFPVAKSQTHKPYWLQATEVMQIPHAKNLWKGTLHKSSWTWTGWKDKF